MSESPPFAQLRDRMRSTAAERDAAEAAQPERAEPAVGDLYLLPASAAPDLDLEWLVVDVRASRLEEGLLEAVPADTGVLVGHTDVQVDGSTPGGPLVLRCAYKSELPTSLFEARWRTGRLDTESMARVRDKLQALRNGTVRAGGDELEAEGDPEYQLWQRDVVEPAVRRLASSSPAVASKVLDFEPTRKTRRVPAAPRTLRSWGLAASALLVVSLTLTGSLLWQSDRLADTEERLTERIAAHERATASHEAELDRLRSAHRDAVTAWERRLDAATRPEEVQPPDIQPKSEPRISMPVAWLLPSTQRGATQDIELRRDVEMVPLFLQLEDVPAYPSYRIELFDPLDQRSIWTTPLPTLGTVVATELYVELPREMLAAGEHQLRLQGMPENGTGLPEGGTFQTFATYRFQLTTAN